MLKFVCRWLRSWMHSYILLFRVVNALIRTVRMKVRRINWKQMVLLVHNNKSMLNKSMLIIQVSWLSSTQQRKSPLRFFLLLLLVLLRTNLSFRIRIESVHVDGRTTVLEQSISIHDDTGQMPNKKSDDDDDDDNDNDVDDNQTEKDLSKAASNIDHPTKMINMAFEPVQKTASTSNVFSRLMHSEEHAQNNNPKQTPILNKAARAAFNEFVLLLLKLKDLSICFFFPLIVSRNAFVSLSLFRLRWEWITDEPISNEIKS